MKKYPIFNKAILMGCFGLLDASSSLPLAVGAAAGYIAHDESFRVTSPIKKTE